MYEGQQMIIRPEYRHEGYATAIIDMVHGNGFVSTNRGTFHNSDLADIDSCPEEWLDEQAETELWG